MMAEFRGFVAPASLKHRIERVWCPLSGHNSGASSPGLIEAPGTRSLNVWPSSEFRGFVAPASVKPGPYAGEGGEDAREFRGFVAPASLKHGLAGGRGAGGGEFRGFVARPH